MSTAVGVVHVRLTERLTDVAISAFLWVFRIGVLFIVVVGSTLTIATGRYDLE